MCDFRESVCLWMLTSISSSTALTKCDVLNKLNDICASFFVFIFLVYSSSSEHQLQIQTSKIISHILILLTLVTNSRCLRSIPVGKNRQSALSAWNLLRWMT